MPEEPQVFQKWDTRPWWSKLAIIATILSALACGTWSFSFLPDMVLAMTDRTGFCWSFGLPNETQCTAIIQNLSTNTILLAFALLFGLISAACAILDDREWLWLLAPPGGLLVGVIMSGLSWA